MHPNVHRSTVYIAKTWKQPKYPLTDEWIKMWYMYKGTYIYIYRQWEMSVKFSSVAQSCLILCDPLNRSTPGLPVHHQLPESTQTYVHWVSDAIQPSHPLLSPSPPALNLSQHQGLFKWVSSSYQVAKVLEFQLQCPSREHPGLLSPKKDWNNAICSNMDGPKVYTKRSKSGKGKYHMIPHVDSEIQYKYSFLQNRNRLINRKQTGQVGESRQEVKGGNFAYWNPRIYSRENMASRIGRVGEGMEWSGEGMTEWLVRKQKSD